MTTLHFTSLESAIHSLFGEGTRIERTSPMSGGDINEAYELTLTGGRRIFVKSNAKESHWDAAHTRRRDRSGKGRMFLSAAGVYLRSKPQQKLLGGFCRTAGGNAPGADGWNGSGWKIRI